MVRLGLAGVAVAVAAALAPFGESVRTVDIYIEHSRFTPSSIDVEPGEKVRFVVHNEDPIDHELIIGDELIQAIHEKGTEDEHGAVPGEISVPALQSAETTYTFDVPGPLIFGCHLPGHYRYGMKGTIAIR